MADYSFILEFTPGVEQVRLRELYGHLEMAINDVGLIGALTLVDGLLVHEQSITPLKAEDLVISERDKLLAGIYTYIYGSKIQSSVTCSVCAQPFDLDFDLYDLLLHSNAKDNQMNIEKLGDNEFQVHEGYSFRLPTGNDELAVAGLPVENAIEALMRRCLLSVPGETKLEDVELEMELLAPMLETDMLAVCPECGKEQNVHFDIQSFLLERLMREQRQVTREVHLIASRYYWGYNEILNLPRSLRRKYASLIDSEFN